MLQYNAFRKGIGAGGYQGAAETGVFRSGRYNVNREKDIIREVQPKEGLYAISRKYQVPVQQIRALNKLESDHLTIGQKLIISKNRNLMPVIQVHDKKFQPYLTAEQIDVEIRRLASEISRDYKGKTAFVHCHS